MELASVNYFLTNARWRHPIWLRGAQLRLDLESEYFRFYGSIDPI